MSDLCWKCREGLKNLEGYDNQVIFYHLHCHHEPKEKEKCWCSVPNAYRAESIDGWLIQYCPKCGRSLNAK